MVKRKLDEALIYFNPLNQSDFQDVSYRNDPASIGANAVINMAVKPITAADKFELAVVFVPRWGCSTSGQETIHIQSIREEIYQLKKVSSNLRIADFGNLKTGKTQEETLFIVQEVCTLLFHLNINVIIFGESQSLTIAAMRSLKEFENNINIAHIDSRIDLSVDNDISSPEFYLNDIIEKELSHLYNISCIGYQSYFVDQKQLNRLSELYFENYRLGLVRENLETAEPLLRDADLISFDMSAIKTADAPGVQKSSPNGFFSDEACRLTRYAGISDRVKCLGIYGFNLDCDNNSQTSRLMAQMVWYYFEGFINRKHEYPNSSLDDCIKYVVEIDEIEIPIVFYKSNKTQRWWLEICNLPHSDEKKESIVVSCTETDYFRACNNEIPDKWWINFKKIR